MNAQDLEDEIVDEEGMLDSYLNHDYKENKINDRYDVYQSLM